MLKNLCLGIAQLTLTLALVAHGADLNWNAIKNGVVQIDTDSGRGAGVIACVQQDLLKVLTAFHVVKDGKNITVTFYWDRSHTLEAKLLDTYDRQLDLAM